MSANRKRDAAIIIGLFLLPLLWFAPQVMGSRSLLPADNLFTFEPWSSHADELAVGQAQVGVPHNNLISDLILENYAWKTFLREALRNGDVPLWNPYLFAGVPFLAAGQHSALYPPSALFYVLPVWYAYGLFTALQLGIAAAGMYVLARLLGQARPAAIVAAVAYAFSGFFIASVNFTMIIAAAAWLPLILAAIEMVVRKASPDRSRLAAVPFVLAGAALLGVQILAGHIEITYYVLMVSAFYAVWRLAGAWRHTVEFGLRGMQRILALGRPFGWLAISVALGIALGAVQLIPLYELVSQSFRQGSASLQQVMDWAWPSRQIITFLLPDAFGNPTHHTYFDIWTRSWHAVTENAYGAPLNTIDWGIKNYVEGANYLGLTTLLLAALAVTASLYRLMRNRDGGRNQHVFYVAGFSLLAVLSLLFAFGTPLYAVLFYLVPGYNQLHSAFRWVYPYTLSMALLAGFGMDMLLQAHLAPGVRRIARWLGAIATVAGVMALGIVAASLIVPGPFIGLGERLLAFSDLARERGFANGAMAWSYEAAGLARFGLLALLAGIVLLWRTAERLSPAWDTGQKDKRAPAHLSVPLGIAHTPSLPLPGRRFWPLAVITLLVIDLWLFGHDFNPATDPHLLSFKPPVVEWLQGQINTSQPWRFATYDAPGEKLLNANAAMPYGLEDIRGYDSIIPRQYVAYMQRIQTQGELLYNRIAPLYSPGPGQPSDALDNHLLDLLGVRYVLTRQPIVNAGYELVYPAEAEPGDEALRVYENTGAFPRVFIVPSAVVAPDQEAALDTLQGVNPAETVVLEGIAAEELPPAASPQVREARISDRKLRQVMVDVNISDRGWLVFTDNYFPGWKAYLRPYGVDGEGVDAEGNAVERQLPLYRANGTFRAVYLDQAGQWTVRFVYSPQSFLLGLYTSFLSGITLLLLGGWWAWTRYYRGEGSEVGTAAKNSLVQVVLSLFNRGIDFAFTMLRLRVLGPVGEGSYVNAINFYLVFEIVTRFGLGTLVTRDVACDRSQARRYLSNVIVLRLLLWLASLPLLFLAGWFYHAGGNLSRQEAEAIAIFGVALLFANVADAISAVFNAFEKMEYPAAVATAITVAKVALGALILLPPLNMGFVGLSGVSLVMNIVQVAWLYLMLRQKVLADEGQPAEVVGAGAGRVAGAKLDPDLQGQMLRESGPLMINHLLATVFWRLSQFVLRAAGGAAALGIFSVGVKFLDGLNVIPSYFTLAIFPLMSRYAQAGNGSLVKAYRLALQLLLITALPIAVFATFAATPLVRVVGGAAFLPDSATALAIMIWSIPIGFVNSVTQYVLIATNRQRFLTKAFAFGVTLTSIANLVFIPRYGYLAAAIILIPAELTLFVPFAWAVHRYVAPIPWLDLCGRPILATLANAAAIWVLNRAGIPLFLSLSAGFLVYVGLLLLLGTFRSNDFAVLKTRFPRLRLRRAVA